jgi:hypothetical protein
MRHEVVEGSTTTAENGQDPDFEGWQSCSLARVFVFKSFADFTWF